MRELFHKSVDAHRGLAPPQSLEHRFLHISALYSGLNHRRHAASRKGNNSNNSIPVTHDQIPRVHSHIAQCDRPVDAAGPIEVFACTSNAQAPREHRKAFHQNGLPLIGLGLGPVLATQLRCFPLESECFLGGSACRTVVVHGRAAHELPEIVDEVRLIEITELQGQASPVRVLI